MADLSNVYDFFFPSPPSLADLACIQIGLDLCCQEIKAYRISGDALCENDPRRKPSLSSILPNVPPRILSLIQPYAQKIALSVAYWPYDHAECQILGAEYSSRFYDFALDFDGTVHHSRTAERIVRSDMVDDDIKFKIACFYCLVDDIVRLWPSVVSQMSITSVNFREQPQLYYWLHKLQEIAVSTNFQPNIETCILDVLYKNFHCQFWPAVKYFLSKLDLAAQKTYKLKLFRNYAGHRSEIFLRYVLAKLNDEDLQTFVNKCGSELLSSSDTRFITRAWTYISYAMNESGFCRLIQLILQGHTINFSCTYDMSVWYEVWTTAPNHLKSYVIASTVSNNHQLSIDSTLQRIYASHSPEFFSRYREIEYFYNDGVQFLSAILSDASLQDRDIFWLRNWSGLVLQAHPKHWCHFIDLCISEELRKRYFKKQLISSYSEIMSYFVKLLRDGDLNKLEEMLAFWCPNLQATDTFLFCKPHGGHLHCTTTKDVRLYLLRNDFVVTEKLMGKADLLKQFIYDAFDDIELASNFKDQLLVVHREKIMESLQCCIKDGRFRNVMEFVDLFAPSENVALRLKRGEIVPALRSTLNDMDMYYLDNCLGKYFEEFENLIPWLLASDDSVVKFKKTLNVGEIVHRLVVAKTSILSTQKSYGVDFDLFDRYFQNLTPTDSPLAKFLKWYFVTSESLEEFKLKYTHDSAFVRLVY